MFGTFRYNTDTKDVEHVQLERIDGFEARGYTRNACNSCRTRKLKCSGDKSGCERCRAASKPCNYPSNVYGDSSADKLRRQSRNTSFEKEDNLEPASRQQPEALAVHAGSEATETHFLTPPSTFADISWTLPSTPSGPDLLWNFSSDENQHSMDDVQDSSSGTTQSRKSASESCTLSTQGKRLQTPIGDVEVENDIADILYDLSPSQPRNLLSNEPSISFSETLNANRSSSKLSQQGNPDFPQELHDAHTYETEDLQSSAEPWRTVLNSISSVGLPIPHSHRSRMRASSANDLVAPPMTPLSATSGYSAVPMGTSARPREHTMNSASGSSCMCVSMMLKTLENMGTRSSGTDARDSRVGLDIVLMSLACGMDTTEEILDCRRCNACIENSMLLAAIAQQLGMMAETVITCWQSQEQSHESHASRKRRRYHGCSPKSRQLSDLAAMDIGGPTIHSLSNDDPVHGVPELLGAGIVLGRYEIQAPEIRLRLVHHALLLHIERLCTILGHIKDRLSANWGARKLVIDIESRVENFRRCFGRNYRSQR